MKRLCIVTIIAALSAALCRPADAWGLKGHTIINELAATSFAHRMPAFVTTPGARFEITYLGAQPDRLKGSGHAWDADNDPAHFVDLTDDATVGSNVSLAHLPASREAYDAALRADGTDEYKQGYLPYAILDGWEQLRMEFAMWRVDNYFATHAHTAAERARESQICAIDEQEILEDIGMWGHYVGDAAQPLHVTVHFNGWGGYPNPQGYTTSRETHSAFESTFVNAHVTPAMVAALVPPAPQLPVPQTLLTQDQALADIASYLQTTLSAVQPLYEIEKAGGFAAASDAAKHFTALRLAAGATELRDLSVLAWQDSLYARVGYPAVSVQDVLSGKVAWPRPF